REGLLIGHDEIAQTAHYVVEHVGGNDAVTKQCLLSLCPRRCHLFASSHWHADVGCWLEAIDTTRSYVMQQGSKEGHTVGLWIDEQEVAQFSGVHPYHLLVCDALGLDASWYAV